MSTRTQSNHPTVWPVVGLIVILAIGCIIPLAGGPPLGDHEALHAQVSRQMIQSGDWVVPHFTNTPYGSKPPLKSWLTAAASVLLEPGQDPPVSPFTARLPSALAAILNVLILWRLGVSLFGPRVGLTAGLIMASSVGLLFFGSNGMMEMLVATICTWAYAQFWWATHASSRGRRWLHFALFYLALGFGVLTKGPVPLAMAGFPIAVWWFLNRPARLALSGAWDWRYATATLGQQTARALTRLWLFPGLLIFAAVFAWWIYLVLDRYPDIKWVWRVQYLGHATGQQLHSGSKGPAYYLPYIFALTAPWMASIFEAAAAPFLGRYRRYRKGLTYAWCWWAAGLLLLSLVVSSKRPHYMLATLGGSSLLLSVVIHRLFSRIAQPSRALVRSLCIVIPASAVGSLVAAVVWTHRHAPQATMPAAIVVGLAAVGFTAAAIAYLCNRRQLSLGLIPATMTAVFAIGWLWVGPALQVDRPIRQVLAQVERIGIEPDAEVYWCDRRPDARVVFYGHRPIHYIITPMEIEVGLKGKVRDRRDLEHEVGKRLEILMAKPTPVYAIMLAKNWGLAHNMGGISGHVLISVPTSDNPDRNLVVVGNDAAKASALPVD